ncbi:DNA-directed RNA polymerase subunit beta [Patescibacteria group bacterium]|nr:DNA-directed RNA polymerase subunit beta [Patescibacteria group bacterium]
MKFKDFSKSKISLPLPYLLSIQKESWQRFWERDLKELFLEISPIRDYTGKELELWFLDYKLDEPKYKTELEAKENNDSYEAALRVKVRLVNLKTKEIKEQEVFLTDFPLMTKRGTFTVNGIERVVISQLIRSPGAFFTSRMIRGETYFGAKIIPNRGAWLEFGTESSGFIGVKIDRKRKVAATTLLRAFLPSLEDPLTKEEKEEIEKDYKEYTKKKEFPEGFLKEHDLKLAKFYRENIKKIGKRRFCSFTEEADEARMPKNYREEIRKRWDELIKEITERMKGIDDIKNELEKSLFKTLKLHKLVTDLRIKKLFQDVETGEIKYISETIKRDSTKNQAEALIEIYQHLRPGDLATAETARELIDNMFFNFERYDLSKVGRWRMWQRLPELKSKVPPRRGEALASSSPRRSGRSMKLSGKIQNPKLEEEITRSDRVLDPADIVAVLREIIRLNNDPEGKPDQIDHLGNRRVRTLNELLQNRLRVGLMRMARIIKDRMATLDISTLTPVQLINSRPFIAIVKEFFTFSQLAQFMDNENPLAELEHKRRLSATGPGGLTRERAGFEVRDVQPSHYGRICPIQTPEGPNVGLINHLAGFARINPYGFIETPYFKVKNGRVTSEICYLNAYEEEKYNIAHGGVLIDEKGKIVPKKVEARIRGKPGIIDREKIDFFDVSPAQSISIATSCIPFLQNDDANRALMGSNMQRQSVPLLGPEVPLVITGGEKRVARDSGQEIIAEEEGIVTEVDADHIKIRGKKGEKKYPLQTFIQTNQFTCFHQKPSVKKRKIVKKGDILTDGGGITRGHLALGRNILVAFMSWRGGTFEDAILISERLVRNDVYTSIHIEDFSCDVRETKLGPEITTCDIPNVSEEKLRNLDEEGLIRIGAEIGPNDILVGKISPKGEVDLTAEERLLRAIFGEKAREVKDTSLLMEHGKQGRVINVKIFSRESGHRLDPGVIKRIDVKVAEIRKIQAGDKLAGRHGNKGVVSMVLPIEDMPFLEDGTPVDIILNPLSIVSRMNIGQVLEAHLGIAAKKLGYIAISPALAGATEEEIKEELRKAGLPEDGKITLYDGRTGLPFPEKITVGFVYMMKLIHMVTDKIHTRSIGPYSLITQQPLGGKAQFGGQRFGEMEVWALEGHGAAHTLQEMLTIKSDDVQGRAAAYQAILKGEPIRHPNIPASLNLLINELKALGLNVEIKEKPKED